MSKDDTNNLGSPEVAQEWKPSFSPWLIALAVMLGTFMEILDTSVANIALPHIAGSYSATSEESTWVLTSYLVSNAIILPASAWFSNLLGRKKFLIISIILFTVSSLFCGLSASLGMLILARVFQGMGGGALQPISQAILLESFPREKRGQAMAIFGMGVIFAPIIGPTLGGWITDNYSWHWIFLINIPIGILAVIMASAFVEDPPYIKNRKLAKLDFLGFGLMALWLATLQIMLDKGEQLDWFSSPAIRWLTYISILSMILFIIRELLCKEPIVNLRVFMDRNFAIGASLIGTVGAILYGTLAILPLFLQVLLNYTAQLSGMAISPRGFGSIAMMVLIGKFSGKIDNRILLVIGFILLSISTYMLGNLNLEIGISNIIFPNILNGAALGLIFVPLSAVTFGTLKNEQIANGTGIFNLMRNIGGGIGISVVSTLLSRNAQKHQAYMVSHLTPYDPLYQQRLHAVTHSLAMSNGHATAAYQAPQVMYNILLGQANLWAFIDNFRFYSLLSLLVLPAIFLFKNVRSGRGGSMAH